MKKYALLIMVGATLAFTSCGGEEKPVEETQSPSENMNNLLQQGINEAAEQLKDSTSLLNQAIDTLTEIAGENKELIEDKVEEGINALNKSK